MSNFLVPNEEQKVFMKKFMDYINDKYKNENPCPNCGSHNVEIDLNALGGGCIDGDEWCNDCGWKKKTNTFKE